MDLSDDYRTAYLAWKSSADAFAAAMEAARGGDDAQRGRLAALQREVTRTYLALLNAAETSHSGESSRARDELSKNQ